MAKRSEKEVREEEIGDMFEAMSNLRTRRLIRRIIASCGVFLSAFRPRVNVLPDQLVTFNAAQRDIGLWLQDEAMNANPEMFIRMNSEAIAHKALDRGDE
jgi:hypothetical protein